MATKGLNSGKSEKSEGKGEGAEEAGDEEVARSETTESGRALYKDGKEGAGCGKTIFTAHSSSRLPESQENCGELKGGCVVGLGTRRKAGLVTR